MKFLTSLSKRKKWTIGISVFLLILWIIPQPSHSRDWKIPQAVLPTAEIKGNLLSVQNLRDFHYRTRDDFDIRYINDTFDLTKLEKVWFVVSHFSEFEGAAHTMLSFEFSDGKTLSISIESRQEKDEDFSPFWGLLKHFEMIYVLGTESDLLQLRTNFREERVYFYPAEITPEKAQKLLKDFIARVQKIEKTPEFYNTLFNNCTNQIVAHIKSFSDKKLPFTLSTLFPGYSDEYAYNLGLIPNDIPLEILREKYRIDNRTKNFTDQANFSESIRSLFP